MNNIVFIGVDTYGLPTGYEREHRVTSRLPRKNRGSAKRGSVQSNRRNLVKRSEATKRKTNGAGTSFQRRFNIIMA